jgi:lipopolysaccharide biosynthesis regulator YciM
MPHPLQTAPGEVAPTLDDSMTAAEAVRIAVAQELTVSHAELAIELLKRAQLAYELDLFALQVINPGVVADRTHLFILAQLGHLHARLDHFEKAMELLSAVSRRYRKEKWWDLLTDALTDMLYCSRKRGNAAEFVHFSLELMYKRALHGYTSPGPACYHLINLFRIQR